MTHFQDLNIRIGKIIAVEAHPNADKLYILLVDLGKIKQDLQIVTGLKDYYREEELMNKKIVVLINLKPAVFRGQESQGMLLAVVDKVKDEIALLTVKKSSPGDKVFVEETDEKPKEQISFDEWKKFKIFTRGKKVYFEDKILKTKKEEIILDKPMDAVVE